MAGLTTAWELSAGEWRNRFESIRVYQRGWRLGGKGASSRGRNGRIEEHGLHVLLGYYQDTFRVMADCYAELDRARYRPGCPIQTWEQAVQPAATVGLTELADGGWEPWSMDFPQRSTMPGGRPALASLSLGGMVAQSLRLLAAFHTSSFPESRRGAASPPPIALSASPHPPGREGIRAGDVLRRAGLTFLASIVELAGRGESMAERTDLPVIGRALEAGLGRIREALYAPLTSERVGKATWMLVDMVMTNLVGIVGDRLLLRPDGLAAIDDLDYRQWLRRHGAAAETLDNAIIRGMYDLVFAYRGGDPAQPAFAAGLGLELATRMLLDYDGSLFWKMQAGMGEVIFAPLYEALTRRGVNFEFFHRVDELTVEDGSIGAIRMGRQVELRQPSSRYEPLVDVDGLPAWPSAPDPDQLEDDGEWLAGAESFFGERRDAAEVVLRAGADFDVVVFAASLGIVPAICGQLIAADPRWRAMVEHLGTVATQAFQVWLTRDDKALGWEGGEGVTLSGFAPPFDTWASMSHLLATEQWSKSQGVDGIAYFCGSVADGATDEDVRRRAERFLDEEVGALWPHAVDAEGRFRWELLAADSDLEGSGRFGSQYWRANVDPSDRYVQSLPGTNRYRLSPGDTGFSNLVVAGDWTDSGLNAGCIEAATRSGILAAAAVASRAETIEGAHD